MFLAHCKISQCVVTIQSVDSSLPKSNITTREAVHMLALSIGLKAAADRTGISHDVIRQWSHRYNWFPKENKHKPEPSLTVTSAPVDILVSEMQSLERRTKLSLAKSAARMAQDAEQATLRDSGLVLNTAKIAAVTHQWQGKGEASSNVMVNVALLGIAPQDMQVHGSDDIIDV